MSDANEIARRKRRSNRAVVGGVSSMVMALLVSSLDVAPLLATTAGAVVGFVLLMYGVHVGWLIFYDREDDGPPS
ncbi:MAG: hypothetical protein ACR2LI_11960 [Propionibacteriaceae bacterium]